MIWQQKLQELWPHIERLGAYGPAAFVPLHLVCTLVFVPTAALSIAAGAMFGFVKGGIAVFLGTLFSSAAGFLAGRYFSRGWLLEKVSRNERLKIIDEAVGQKGLRLVFLLRISALFPYMLLNYGLGLANISFRDYLIATAAGSLPGLAYVYVGSLAKTSAADRAVQPFEWALMAASLTAVVIVGTTAARLVRRTLKQA